MNRRLVVALSMLLAADTSRAFQNPNANIRITTTSLPNGQMGVPYSATLGQKGGKGPVIWLIVAGSLPPGLGLDAFAGTIAGTPAASGTFSFTVTVTDTRLSTDSANLAIGVAPPLSVTTTALPGGTVGASYSAALTAAGGTPPYGWGVAGGSPPAGIAVSTAGQVSGTPSSAGTFNFTVQVTDSARATALQPLSLQVNQQTSPLTITTAVLPNGVPGLPYSGVLNASGGTPPYTWSTTGGALPPGLSFSAAGQVSGTPTAAGNYDITAQVADAAGATASKAFGITIASNLAVATTSLPGGEVGVGYSASLAATGGTSRYSWTIISGSLPAGLTLTLTGQISGTPSAAGTAAFTVQVGDSAGSAATQPLAITIAPPLSISTSTLPNGEVGLAYSAAVTSSGGIAPYTWSIAAGQLPAGLTMNGSGQIGGAPTAAGTANFTVQVSDAAGISVSQAFSITVTPPLAISTGSLPNGLVGTAYSQTLAATGGSTPYSWSIAAGSLPAGLNLDASGQIGGTPTAAGTAQFTVKVSDAAGASVTKALSIAVLEPLAITTGTLPNGVVGTGYSASLSASGGTAPYSWSITAGALPAGLNLNASGQIGGTPAAAGTANFTAQVSDNAGATASKALAITIAASLGITSTSLPNGVAGTAYSATLAAAGGTPPYTWSVTAGTLPAGLSLGAGGQITGTPSAPGTSNFTVKVSDSAGGTATQALALTIGNALAVSTGTLPQAKVGTAYSATLSAAGGTPPYTWSVTSGSLPAGLSLNAAGQIGGTPGAAGPAGFTVEVRDSAGSTATQALSINVVAATPLAVSTTGLVDGEIGVSYSQSLSAVGGTPPYTWSVAAGALPNGLSLSAGGQLAGTPSAAGFSTFTLRVSDSAGDSATRGLGINVAARVAITTAPQLPDAGLGSAYTQTLAAGGGAGPYSWTVSGGTIPPGLTLDPNTGALSGKPTSAGTFTFTIQVRDRLGSSAMRDFTVVVASTLTITTSSPLPVAVLDTPYSQAMAAIAGSPPYQWSVTAGALPAGLTLNGATGVISGTPTSAGASTFTLQVTDSAKSAVSREFSLTVVGALTITTASPLPGGSVGAPYSQVLSAVAGTSPYTWSIAAGALPGGLSLDATTGTISGTPATPGGVNVTIQVKDSAGNTATKPFALTISTALSLSTPPDLPAATAGKAYSAALAVSGGTPPYTWAISSGTLPAGLTLDAAAGKLAGTPTAAGPFTFGIQVTDAAKVTASQGYALTVGLLPLPAASITGLSDTANPREQPKLDLTLASAYPIDVKGRLTLSFSPDAVAPSDDPAIQFSTSGRTVDFTIPANSTHATFPAPELALQTGSVAGTITVTAAFQAGGIDATPSPAPSRAVKIARSAPVISSLKLVKTGSGFEVWITGYSPPREITQATFQFTAAAGGGLNTSQLNQPMTDSASQWYNDSASAAYGSQFTIVQPFTVQGNQNAVSSVSVTLANSAGTSQAATATF